MGLYSQVQGGQSDPECSHVILKLDEYEALLVEIRKAKRKASQSEEDAGKAIAKAQAEAELRIKANQTDAEQIIQHWKQVTLNERKGKEYQIGLNKNLLRISRERANADRKIKPKKERSGYVFISMGQRNYRYRVDRNHWEDVILWDTVIQTPYSIQFTAEQAITESMELFARDDNGEWLIGRLGLDYEYDGKYEEMIDDNMFPDWQNFNVILDKRYNANGRAGYWEIIITHTKPLDNNTAEL